MEKSCKDGNNSLTTLQLGMIQRYSQLTHPLSQGCPVPTYLQYISRASSCDKTGPGGSFTGIDFNPLIGAFHPYAPPAYHSRESLSESKSRRSTIHPLLLGQGIHGQRRSRGEKKCIPDEQKDDRYYERRKRNNQAAKKSRDARKMREDQIALRAAILEHENAMMRAQIVTLREETQALRGMLLVSNKSADRDPDRASPVISTISPSFLNLPVISPLINKKNNH